LITFKKTTGSTANLLPGVSDYLIWFAKDRDRLKYNQLYFQKEAGGLGGSAYGRIELSNRERRSLSKKEKLDAANIPEGSRIYRVDNLTSQSPGTRYDVEYEGESFYPKGYWKTDQTFMPRVVKSKRAQSSGVNLYYVRFIEDFPVFPVTDNWDDTTIAGFASDKQYVVETSIKVIERCLLMTTDPGDLVLDPTCGSGTTAFVAEKWGRRWITCDTSRVAITLAKQRLMTASFDYYALRYPHEGLKGGFDYETVPHITLKSIANNPDIDTIYDEDHPTIATALDDLNAALKAKKCRALKITSGARKGKSVEFTASDDVLDTIKSTQTTEAWKLLLGEVTGEFPDDFPEEASVLWDVANEDQDALDKLNAMLRGQKLSFKTIEGWLEGREVKFDAPEGAKHFRVVNTEVPRNAMLAWEVPFDLPTDWPEAATAPFEAFHKARQAMQRRMDQSIADHADQETLYDKPRIDKNKLRITGPFSVEAVPAPTVLSLDESLPAEEADSTVARSGETSRQSLWRDELLKTGVRGKGGNMMRFAEFEVIPGTKFLHASGSVADTGERVVVSFGPEHAALEQRQVEEAMNEAYTLMPKPKFLLFCAFTFDPEAAKDIDEMNVPGMTFLKVQMNTDLLTEDLKKKRASNESFWLMGQPEVDVRKRGDGMWEVEVHGFDYFNPKTGEIEGGGTKQIAMWSLDQDYDQRSLMPHQVFFPMADAKGGWNRLKKTIRAELDEDLLEQFHGTVSLPFEAGDNKRIAVKIVDDRGIESLKIVALEG